MKTSWNCSGFRFSLDIEHLTRDSMKLLTGNPLKSDWSLAMLRNPLASSILDKFFLCWSKCISWPSTLVNSIFSKIRFELLKIDYFPVFRVLEFNFQLRSARRWKDFWFLKLKLSQGPAKNQDESRFDFGKTNKKTKANFLKVWRILYFSELNQFSYYIKWFAVF